MAHRLGAMLVLGSESLCKSTKTMLWHCDFWWWRKGCREAVLNISFRQKRLEQNPSPSKTSRHNAPWTKQSLETKRTLQSHIPSWWLPKSVVVPTKKVNMYIVGCFDSHFAIASNWLAVKRTGSHPHASRLPQTRLISRYGLTMSWVAWVGVGKRLEKERCFFSILHNVGSMTKNLCKSFKSCCTKIGSKDLATSNDKVLKSRRQKWSMTLPQTTAKTQKQAIHKRQFS